MQPEDVILVEDYCLNYAIDQSFVFDLEEYGLVELVVVEEKQFIPLHQVPVIEKFSHLYYELDINVDGIDAISHLLRKVEMMQEEIRTLRNRLRVYEGRP
jgi:chaperone modulatory protein CbpM